MQINYNLQDCNSTGTRAWHDPFELVHVHVHCALTTDISFYCSCKPQIWNEFNFAYSTLVDVADWRSALCRIYLYNVSTCIESHGQDSLREIEIWIAFEILRNGLALYWTMNFYFYFWNRIWIWNSTDEIDWFLRVLRDWLKFIPYKMQIIVKIITTHAKASRANCEIEFRVQRLFSFFMRN